MHCEKYGYRCGLGYVLRVFHDSTHSCSVALYVVIGDCEVFLGAESQSVMSSIIDVFILKKMLNIPNIVIHTAMMTMITCVQRSE